MVQPCWMIYHFFNFGNIEIFELQLHCISPKLWLENQKLATWLKWLSCTQFWSICYLGDFVVTGPLGENKQWCKTKYHSWKLSYTCTSIPYHSPYHFLHYVPSTSRRLSLVFVERRVIAKLTWLDVISSVTSFDMYMLYIWGLQVLCSLYFILMGPTWSLFPPNLREFIVN